MEPQRFVCIPCDFTSFNESNYNKHLKTAKHKEKTEYRCHYCTTYYKHHQSLYRHQKTCSMSPANFVKDIKENISMEIQEIKENIVLEIYEMKDDIKQTNTNLEAIAETNAELKSDIEAIAETSAEMKTTIVTTISEIATTVVETSSTNQAKLLDCITSINGNTNAMYETVVVKCVDQLTAMANKPAKATKRFNLEHYLNETCKEAENIEDFLKNLSPDYDDVVFVGKNGYVEGNLGVILKYLQKMEQQNRPIQCSDAKRQTVYLKTKDKWEKDGDGLPKTSDVVERACNKTYRSKKLWETKHPEHDDLNHKKSEEHQHLLYVMSGGNRDIDAQNGKIAAKVVKSCQINKETE